MTTCPPWCAGDHDAARPFHHDAAPHKIVTARDDRFVVQASQFVDDDGDAGPVSVTVLVNGEGPYVLARRDAHELSHALFEAVRVGTAAPLPRAPLRSRLREAWALVRYGDL